jgi:hypothetical protein
MSCCCNKCHCKPRCCRRRRVRPRRSIGNNPLLLGLLALLGIGNLNKSSNRNVNVININNDNAAVEDEEYDF